MRADLDQRRWCPKMRSCALTRHDALHPGSLSVAETRSWRAQQVRRCRSWGPVCRVLHRFLVSLARLAVRSGRSKGLEIIVLRHQLAVLRSQAAVACDFVTVDTVLLRRCDLLIDTSKS